jgi:hypothetical protein
MTVNIHAFTLKSIICTVHLCHPPLPLPPPRVTDAIIFDGLIPPVWCKIENVPPNSSRIYHRTFGTDFWPGGGEGGSEGRGGGS